MNTLTTLLRSPPRTLLVCLLAGCSVDTSVISPAYVKVSSENICPCEAVTIEWSCPSNGSEYYCDLFSVNSTNPDTDPEVGPREKSGERKLPVCLTTGFTMELEYEGRTDRTGAGVLVISEGTTRTRSYELQARCRGANIVWDPLPLKELNSPCIAITNFCNNTGEVIRVVREGETSPTAVVPGCTTNFNGASHNLGITPTRVPYYGPGESPCGSTMMNDLPGPLAIAVTIECNRELEHCDL